MRQPLQLQTRRATGTQRRKKPAARFCSAREVEQVAEAAAEEESRIVSLAENC
jgi:hypothetical protein